MKILFTTSFVRHYRKLSRDARERIDTTIEIFRNDPYTPTLRNHPLKGAMKGRRSLSAGFDLRIIFEERDDYAVVIMIAVGKHEDVYE